MSTAVPVPGGTIARRPLQFFWLADHSGSKAGKKIATLNPAIREALPEVRKAVAAHPEVEILMRAIKFSDAAELLKFVSHPEIGVLRADTPQKLVTFIRWASVAASVGASQGKSLAGGASPDNVNVALGGPPPNPSITSSTDLF